MAWTENKLDWTISIDDINTAYKEMLFDEYYNLGLLSKEKKEPYFEITNIEYSESMDILYSLNYDKILNEAKKGSNEDESKKLVHLELKKQINNMFFTPT